MPSASPPLLSHHFQSFDNLPFSILIDSNINVTNNLVASQDINKMQSDSIGATPLVSTQQVISNDVYPKSNYNQDQHNTIVAPQHDTGTVT